jgi:DNA polymerase III epsilon subunit-like protein
MNDGTEWLIVDTETDGLYEPIHIVEIAAQRMRGWDPHGEPLRVLLNHDIPISPDVVAIHGYSAEFLSKHGLEPAEAHARLKEYANGLSFVSHNLAFDWNRCFDLEWQRLDIQPFGRRGFCALTLARRVIHESPKHSLETLKNLLGLKANVSHRALNDVATLVELFQGEYRRRLEAIGITSFEGVAKFSKAPIAKCHQLLSAAQPVKRRPEAEQPQPIPVENTRKPEPETDAAQVVSRLIIGALKLTPPKNEESTVDAWYYLDSSRKPAGPLASFIIRDYLMRNMPSFHVWRAGMQEWELSESCTDFNDCYEKSKSIPTPSTRSGVATPTADELAKMCRGIVSSGKVTSHEIHFLGKWLMESGLGYTWPGTELAALIERILEDGVVTQEERDELADIISKIYAR